MEDEAGSEEQLFEGTLRALIPAPEPYPALERCRFLLQYDDEDEACPVELLSEGLLFQRYRGHWACMTYCQVRKKRPREHDTD